MLQVKITNERILSAYQNVLVGRPSATDIALETNSVREAVEYYFSIEGERQDYETIRVFDDKQGNLSRDLNLIQIAMNSFRVYTDYIDGKLLECGYYDFGALGEIDTTNERNQLWKRVDHVRYKKTK
jgi:hypothetical protein